MYISTLGLRRGEKSEKRQELYHCVTSSEWLPKWNTPTPDNSANMWGEYGT